MPRALTANAGPDYSSGAMVALYPDPETAALLALDDGLPPDDIHVTLLYLGDVADVIDPGDLLSALEDVATFNPPLSGQVGGAAVFAGDPLPVVGAVDVPGLVSLRATVDQVCDEIGQSSPSEHDFNPHVTLDYQESNDTAVASLANALSRLPVPITFRELTLVLGDQRTPIPLGHAYEPVDPSLFNELAPSDFDEADLGMTPGDGVISDVIDGLQNGLTGDDGQPVCLVCAMPADMPSHSIGDGVVASAQAILAAGACTGPGPCVTSPLGLKRNWVTKVGGLPPYIRAIAHAMQRHGRSESQAIQVAIGIVKRWAAGAGNVTAATRARAAAAVAGWEADKAKAHAASGAPLVADGWDPHKQPRGPHDGRFLPEHGSGSAEEVAHLTKQLAGPIDSEAKTLFKGGSAAPHLVTDKTGTHFTPERAALHQQIIEDTLRGKGHPQEHPRFTMLGGGAASGKTAARYEAEKETPDSVVIDPDAIKAQLPEYNPANPQTTHEESSYLGKRLIAEAQRRRHHIILDAVGNSTEKSMRSKIDQARAAGYSVHGRYVTAPTEVAVQRAAQRERKVPLEVVRSLHRGVSQVVPQIMHHFDTFSLHDQGGERRLVASHSGDKLKVHDPSLWDQFLSKADEGRTKGPVPDINAGLQDLLARRQREKLRSKPSIESRRAMVSAASAPSGKDAKAFGPITHAGVVLKAADTGRVLMLQRGLGDENDPAAGKWEFPGGQLEQGDESPLDGAQREWAEEVGQSFPEGGECAHSWIAPNGSYQGHVVVIPEEKAVVLHQGREVDNPDDPDGDESEQVAWWEPDDAKANPALREEVGTTPWDALKQAGAEQQLARLDAGSGEFDLGEFLAMWNPQAHPRGPGGEFEPIGRGAGQDHSTRHGKRERQWIRHAQRIMQRSGVNVDINGRFDGSTEKAVRHYQRRHGLEVNGTIDRATAQHLMETRHRLNNPNMPHPNRHMPKPQRGYQPPSNLWNMSTGVDAAALVTAPGMLRPVMADDPDTFEPVDPNPDNQPPLQHGDARRGPVWMDGSAQYTDGWIWDPYTSDFRQPTGKGPELPQAAGVDAVAFLLDGSGIGDFNKWVKKRGDKWVIIQKGTGKTISSHDSKAKAHKAFKGMMARKG